MDEPREAQAGQDLLLRALLARDALVTLQAATAGPMVRRVMPDGTLVIHRERRRTGRFDRQDEGAECYREERASAR